MTARELAERILSEIVAGELDPNAIVVRPHCLCDESIGYVEAQFLDDVVRRFEQPDGTRGAGSRIYKYGNVPPGPGTVRTIKLG